jgi:argininosuccinate lyase
MPQKKNPDVAELVRGKSGRVFGGLMGILTMMKGLPLAYNKDMQEDKEAFFDVVDTLEKCLLVMAPLLETARFRTERMARAAAMGFSNATDLADYLVRRGLAFRDAHHTAGVLVSRCLDEHCGLEDLPLEVMREALPAEVRDMEGILDGQVYEALKLEHVVGRRDVYGGTAPSQVRAAIGRAKAWLRAVD